jgi:DNA-binding NtrC family response regulator
MAMALVVDDDRSIRRTLEKLLVGQGYSVATAADGAQAMETIRGHEVDVVLLDLGLPVFDGLSVLAEAQRLENAPPIVVITAREDMQSTIRAVQLGAYDYLVKPLDAEHVMQTIERALQSRAYCAELPKVDLQRREPAQRAEIVGRSTAMREIYKTIGAVSTTHASVLIRGESGTGKELVARAIHESSRDRDKPFVAVNCTALSRGLIESELFGHVRGAFTGAVADKIGRFELADSGTLFLDEIADIPSELQAKLLRVLQERSFERVGDGRPVALRARVIAATHRNLPEMVRAGSFREDLLYRLKVVEIALPPLRERREDLPLLIERLIAKICKQVDKCVGHVTPSALALLENYAWPGNIRELENALTRAVVLAKGHVIEADHLALPLPAACEMESDADEPPMASLADVEKRHIARVLAHTHWNKRRACSLLQVSRPTLDRKIEEYALSRQSVPC